MILQGEVYFIGLMLDWIGKWTSLSLEFLPLQDLPSTRLRAFLVIASSPNRSSTSATSIYSSQRHQDRSPDDLQADAPSRPKLHTCLFEG